jgi:hypothetical protein
VETRVITNTSEAKGSLGLQAAMRSWWASTTKILPIPPVNIEKYFQMAHVFNTFLHFPLKELSYTMKFTI